MTTRASDYRALLTTYLRPQQARVALLAVALVADIGLQLANPQILRFFIDTARSGGAPDALANAAGLFLAVVVGAQLVSSLATYLSEDVGWTATNLLRADLALHCLRLDSSFHKTHAPGELIERVDGDTAVLSGFFSAFVIRVLGNGLLLVGILVLIAREDWRVGLALLAYTGVALATLRCARRLPARSFAAFRQASADLSGFWEEQLAGTEDIRANGAVAYALGRQDGLLRALMRHGRATMVLGRAFLSVLEALTAVGSALAFALGAYLLGAGAITIGTVFLVFYYTGLLSDRLGDITAQLNTLQSASVGLARITDLYHTRPAIRDGAGAALPPGPPALRFDDVSFGYDEGDLALQNVSFQLSPGRVLGVLGRTGSGKTTLARLVARLYDPRAGVILLDDVDLRDLRLTDLRHHIGLVTQDVQLFGATVRDNLTLFAGGVADERILRALADLGLTAWYEGLPRGLDTEIAAGALSAGQAQLLALARVFLREPGLIVLDEASSRLDPATERLLEQAIDRLFEDRSAIVIAHRLATVERADDILVLNGGRAVECGPRARLAADPASHYARLLRVGLETPDARERREAPA